MLESFLRKAFPRPLLRKLAIDFNSIKIKTIDKLLYTSCKVNREDYFYYHEQQPYTELPRFIQSLEDPLIRNGMAVFRDTTDVAYILEYKHGCYIEPENGWGISKDGHLIYPSLGTSNARYLKKPSLLAFYSKRKHAVHLQQAISLRDISERAYFHFYNDVMSKIPYLQKQGIDVKQVPVIIAERLFNKPFFKDLLAASPFFRSLNWLIQRDQFIYCEKVIFCKPPALHRELYDHFADILIAGMPAAENNRIFLTRDKKRLRYIDNMQQIESVLEKHHFKIVDADNLSLPQQAILFRNTRYLVGIHGAGFTNMIFRKDHPLHIFELFPPDQIIPYHYAVLASQYGYQYNAMRGEPGKTKYSGGFTVDPEKLDRMLQKIATD